LGVEEIIDRNMFEKIKLTGKDEDGNEIEYFVAQPSIFELTYMITPYFKTYSDSLKIIGSIIKLIKDDNLIPVEKYDWHENNKSPIIITSLPGYSIEKQMQFCSMLGFDYRPSMFYKMSVGINSDKKELFQRVKERKFETTKKN
jgi:hypothetical protein